MKLVVKIILLSVIPLTFAAAENTDRALPAAKIPFLFQIIPFLPFDDIRIDADVNIGMVAAAASSVNNLQFAVGTCFAEEVEALQISGVMNYAESLSSVSSLQVTIGASFADEVEGLQVLGVLNYTDRLNGTQIGIFNRAEKGNGCQIGVFNFSDDPEITSIGLFNFHEESWMDFLLLVDSVCGADAACQIGIGSFYSCYSGGVIEDPALSFASSLTVGARLTAGIFFMDAECGIFQRHPEDSEADISALLRIKGGVKIFDVFSIFVGAGGLAGTSYIPESAVLSASSGGINFLMSFFGGAAVSIKV